MAETNNWLPRTELPEGSLVTEVLLVVNYLDEDGSRKYMVAVKGESPATTYLGMTVRAQQEILAWE